MVCTPLNTKSFIFSNWVPGWLPIRYKFASNKWPVNTFDLTDIYNSVSDANGFANIIFATTQEIYVAKEYIKITDSTNGMYDGVWQILQKNSSTDFIISAPYVGNDTAGEFQRYYQGYNIQVQVYTGIPSGHTLFSNNPMALRATLKTLPNSNNESIVDISSIVRDDLAPVQNNLCGVLGTGNFHGNDTNLWTAFYIAYAEGYLTSDGSAVSEYVEDFYTDVTSYETNIQFATYSALQFQDLQGRSVGRFVIGDTDPDTVQAEFMTTFERPVMISDKEFDLSIGIGFSNSELATEGFGLEYVLTQYDSSNTLLTQDISPVEQSDQGVYRFAFSEYPLQGNTSYFTFYIRRSTGEQVTELKRVDYNAGACKRRGDIYLRWLNIYGGFDGWWFNRAHDYLVNVSDRKVIRRDIYKEFDDNFTAGDTQDDYFSTTAKQKVIARTQVLTDNQADQMKWLRTSNKVYECFTAEEEGCSKYKVRTVLIEPGEVIVRTDRDKRNKAVVTFEYTDEMIIPGQ